MLNEDIIEVLHEFHENKRFEKSVNTTFFALIPKKSSIVEAKGYRYISLVGGLYMNLSLYLYGMFLCIYEWQAKMLF